ncbi:hypothetical protein AKJ16_DCAP12033, partial [Drosera capensis]
KNYHFCPTNFPYKTRDISPNLNHKNSSTTPPEDAAQFIPISSPQLTSPLPSDVTAPSPPSSPSSTTEPACSGHSQSSSTQESTPANPLSPQTNIHLMITRSKNQQTVSVYALPNRNSFDSCKTTAYLSQRSSRQQRAIARSSTEAEYRVIATTAAELSWVRLSSLGGFRIGQMHLSEVLDNFLLLLILSNHRLLLRVLSNIASRLSHLIESSSHPCCSCEDIAVLHYGRSSTADFLLRGGQRRLGFLSHLGSYFSRCGRSELMLLIK